MTDDIDIAQPYVGKWTCSECGDTSDNEHDPCSCDDTCTEHIETIDSLRRRLKQDEAERDALRQQLEAVQSEADAWEKIARERHATLEAVTRERDEAHRKLTKVEGEFSDLVRKTIAHPMAVVVERETAEAIAAWLDGVSLYYSHNRNIGPFISETAESIRARCFDHELTDKPRRVEGQQTCAHGVTPCDVHHGSLSWRAKEGK